MEITALSSKQNQLNVLVRAAELQAAEDAVAPSAGSNQVETLDLSQDHKSKPAALKPATKQTLLPVINKHSQRANKAVARFIIQSGQPWSVCRDPSFIQLCRDLSGVPESYLPPSEDQVKGKHLDDLYEEATIEIKELLEIIQTFGCSLISDGWSDINGTNVALSLCFQTLIASCLCCRCPPHQHPDPHSKGRCLLQGNQHHR